MPAPKLKLTKAEIRILVEFALPLTIDFFFPGGGTIVSASFAAYNLILLKMGNRE